MEDLANVSPRELYLQAMEQLRLYWSWWLNELETNPLHVYVETGLAVIVLYIILFKVPYDAKKRGYGGRQAPQLTNDEVEDLIDEWEPEPLVPPGFVSRKDVAVDPNVVVITRTCADGKHVEVEEVDGEVLNCAGTDFLGLGSHPDVKQTARDVMEEYAVGSCGPRGFYGTTMKHLDLETAIAKFMNVPESISYSDATFTVTSVIPAFAKRGDVLVMDSGCNLAVQTGSRLSRSKVIPFKHNDLADLRSKLEGIKKGDRKNDLSSTQRRFIVIEGLYANHGDFAPVAEIVALAREFKVRVMLDDCLAWGALGATGRGSAEESGVDPTEVDILMGSLTTTLSAVGGFCIGSREAVDHQRLSGAGYCFSASSPPYLNATAETALEVMQTESHRLGDLRENARELHAALSGATEGLCSIDSVPSSPLLHARLAGEVAEAVHAVAVAEGHVEAGKIIAARGRRPGVPRSALSSNVYGVEGFMETLPLTSQAAVSGDGEEDAVELLSAAEAHRVEYREAEQVWDDVVRGCVQRGVLVARSRYMSTDSFAPAPSLRITVTALMDEDDIAAIVDAVAEVLEEVGAAYVKSARGRVDALEGQAQEAMASYQVGSAAAAGTSAPHVGSNGTSKKRGGRTRKARESSGGRTRSRSSGRRARKR